MSTPTRSIDLANALLAVSAGRVRYHDGLSGPADGYTWTDNDAHMPQATHDLLHFLWLHDYIDLAGRVLCSRGYRVEITTEGFELLRNWGLASASR